MRSASNHSNVVEDVIREAERQLDERRFGGRKVYIPTDMMRRLRASTGFQGTLKEFLEGHPNKFEVKVIQGKSFEVRKVGRQQPPPPSTPRRLQPPPPPPPSMDYAAQDVARRERDAVRDKASQTVQPAGSSTTIMLPPDDGDALAEVVAEAKRWRDFAEAVSYTHLTLPTTPYV